MRDYRCQGPRLSGDGTCGHLLFRAEPGRVEIKCQHCKTIRSIQTDRVREKETSEWPH